MRIGDVEEEVGVVVWNCDGEYTVDDSRVGCDVIKVSGSCSKSTRYKVWHVQLL